VHESLGGAKASATRRGLKTSCPPRATAKIPHKICLWSLRIVFRKSQMQQSRRNSMNLILLLCLFGTFGCGNAALPPHSEWTKVTSEDGRISALFPRPPESQNKSLDSEIGKLDFEMTVYESGTSVFITTQLTYPIDPSQYDVEAGLDGAAQGAAQNVNGTLLENDDIEAFGFPGKSLLISAPQGIFLRGRVFIDPAGPTLFQAQVGGTRAVVDGPDAAAFLDSLTLK